MEMQVDLKKNYRTRDGRAVRLISDQGHANFPIIGYIDDEDMPYVWRSDGGSEASRITSFDLVEVKASFKGDAWLVVAFTRTDDCLPGHVLTVFTSKWDAEHRAKEFTKAGTPCAIQRVTLNVTEGEVTE